MVDDLQALGLGWKRQNPDWRDEQYMLRAAPGLELPHHFDLYRKMPPIWQQSGLGSCTAHGSLRAYVMERMKLGEPIFMPSRLFQYYNSRRLEGSTNSDAGASCRDAIKAIGQWGATKEEAWPYIKNKFATRPPDSVYNEAIKHKALIYRAVPQDLYSIKAAIFSGFGVVFGFTVYSNFTGIGNIGLAAMPSGHVVGGHCVVAIGWNSKNYFMCANSWGTGWGDPDYPGCFWMPPDYISHSQLAADFWTIENVQE